MDTIIAISKRKNIALSTAIFTLAFCVPLLFNGSQIITGSIINTLLFVSAAKFSKRTLPFIAVIPSLGAVSNGILFGPFTIYLVYFLPFIWMGNYLLMRIAKNSNILLAAFTKSVFLYSVAYVFVSFQVVPKVFLTAMGVLQFVTALIGGIFAIGILKYILKPAHE